MAAPRVLFSPRLPADSPFQTLFDDFARDFDVTALTMSPEQLLSEMPRYDAMVFMGESLSFREPALWEAVAREGKLRILAKNGVGYDIVDAEAAARAGTWVSNTPDVVSAATADVAMFLLLAVSRRTTELEQVVRSGKWAQLGSFNGLPFRGNDLGGKTVGIVGLGRIGKTLARRVRAFDVGAILYYKRNQLAANEEAELGVRYVPLLDDLLSQCDLVVCLVPHSPDTTHLFDAARFCKFRRGALFINVSRGKLVDEAALADALADGQLGGAGLDVFEDEPRVNAKLLECARVTVLPHIGTHTVETRSNMLLLSFENVRRVLRGDLPKTPVNTPVPRD